MIDTFGRIEIQKFNDTSFKLCKMKMEDILIEKYLWVAISRLKPINMQQADWDFGRLKSQKSY